MFYKSLISSILEDGQTGSDQILKAEFGTDYTLKSGSDPTIFETSVSNPSKPHGSGSTTLIQSLDYYDNLLSQGTLFYQQL